MRHGLCFRSAPDTIDPGKKMTPQTTRTRASSSGGGGAVPERSGTEVFEALWRELADILGGVATTALVRRAAHRGAPRCPELVELAAPQVFEGPGFVLPLAWRDPSTPPALVELARE